MNRFNMQAHVEIQPRAAAPFTRTTSAQVLRKPFAIFDATAFAFIEEHTPDTGGDDLP